MADEAYSAKELVKSLNLVLNSLVQGCSQNDLETACDWILKAYSEKVIGTQGANISYRSNSVRSAYLYLYAPLHIGFVSIYLQNLMRKWQLFDQWFLEMAAMNSSKMDVCALGGGPGLEMGCVYLWIEKLCQERNEFWMLIQAMNLTVCDINRDWEPVYRRLMAESSKRSIRLQPNFICSDLTSPSFTPEIRNAIGRSDLVLMVKFLSVVPKQTQECLSMLRNIMNCMKPGALLLVIDGRHRMKKDLLDQAASTYGLNTIFKDENVFTLNEDFNVIWKSTYGTKFVHKKPMEECKIFVRILQKPDNGRRMTATILPLPKKRTDVASAEHFGDTRLPDPAPRRAIPEPKESGSKFIIGLLFAFIVLAIVIWRYNIKSREEVSWATWLFQSLGQLCGIREEVSWGTWLFQSLGQLCGISKPKPRSVLGKFLQGLFG